MKLLLTFSGKYGDILWSLPVAKALHERGEIVDFAVMRTYDTILDLVKVQPYIHNAFSLPEWVMVDTAIGARPRIPPVDPPGYDKVLHLGYNSHPGPTLIENGFRIADLKFPAIPLPFLEVGDVSPNNIVAYAFNHEGKEQKERVRAAISASTGLPLVNVATMPFLKAATIIQEAKFFLGCRSANYVIACGLNKRCLTIEPHTGRRTSVFGCPQSPEVMPDWRDIDAFVKQAKEWM